MELALYGEAGFFERVGSGAGRRADFLTSPEIGPLFGACVAGALDAEWERLRRPDPYVVVEAGAGRGALCAAVLGAAPACAPALRYLCVERSSTLRAAAEEALPAEPVAEVLGPVLPPDADDEDVHPLTGAGPMVAVLGELPVVRLTGVVFANELLDNLPFRLLERTGDGWAEVRVDASLREVLVPTAAGPDVAAAPGARVPIQRQASEWVRTATGLLAAGRVVVVDYADTTASMAGRLWTDWLRTYRSHGRGGHPLEWLGEQDVTCEVAVDQLPPPSSDTAQAEWLRRHGLVDLVAEARAAWHERAAIGDLAAVRARSRVSEADALTDPTGPGAFRVLEWVVA